MQVAKRFSCVCKNGNHVSAWHDCTVAFFAGFSGLLNFIFQPGRIWFSKLEFAQRVIGVSTQACAVRPRAPAGRVRERERRGSRGEVKGCSFFFIFPAAREFLTPEAAAGTRRSSRERVMPREGEMVLTRGPLETEVLNLHKRSLSLTERSSPRGPHGRSESIPPRSKGKNSTIYRYTDAR